MLNNVVLIGRLTKDPELRYTPAGKAVCTVRLAVDRGTKDAEGRGEADFLDVVCWEKTAESVANYLNKGRLIAIQGRIQSRTYEAQDGGKREKVEIVAAQVKFLPDGSRTNGEGGSQGGGPQGGSRGGSMGSEPAFSDDDDVLF